MKFSVACNWDPALLDRLSKESSSVDSLFGQITDDPFGGGRGSFLAPKVTREQAREFIPARQEFCRRPLGQAEQLLESYRSGLLVRVLGRDGPQQR